MKKFTILLSTMLIYAALGYSQVAINMDGAAPDNSAILDLTSTNKGFLLPRMTTVQISGISAPAAGLLVYNTDSSDFYGYNGSKWMSLWNTGDTLADWYCGNPIVDFRDGQSYATVQIGTQCWMAENLNIGTMINSSSSQINNGTIEKYCFSDNTSNCDTYGGLYQWNEAMQYVTTTGTQGICPDGWHFPTDDEWKTMEMYLGMSQTEADATGWRGTDEGGKLKEAGTAHWNTATGATNSSGFTGLPGGYWYSGGLFLNLTYQAHFWTSNENGSYAWSRALFYSNAQIDHSSFHKNYGFSVRCIKD